MPIKKLKAFLDDHGVKYRTIRHPPAYTAQEIAATAHVPGRELAKTVMVVLDGKMAIATLPASDHVELGQLRKATGASTAEIAKEADFAHLFPDCEIGAMPPFGNLYGMETYVAERLTKDEEIAFNAGTHTELLLKRHVRAIEPMVARVLVREPREVMLVQRDDLGEELASVGSHPAFRDWRLARSQSSNVPSGTSPSREDPPGRGRRYRGWPHRAQRAG